MEKIINILKYSGETEAFNLEKLKRSLRHSKANEKVVNEIAEEIQSQLTEGMTTKRIYEIAYKMLKRKSKPGSSRYKLKNPFVCRFKNERFRKTMAKEAKSCKQNS